MPSVSAEPHGDVFTERPIRRTVERYLVGVVYPTKVGQLEMGGERRGLAADAFHHVAIAAKCVNVVVENLKCGAVAARLKPFAGDGHAYTVSDALAQRPGCGLDSRGDTVFGMAWRSAVQLAKTFDVVEHDRRPVQNFVFGINRLHAGEIKHRVKQHRRMTVR